MGGDRWSNCTSPGVQKRGDARIELATSCTLSKNHTTRPITRVCRAMLDPFTLKPGLAIGGRGGKGGGRGGGHPTSVVTNKGLSVRNFHNDWPP